MELPGVSFNSSGYTDFVNHIESGPPDGISQDAASSSPVDSSIAGAEFKPLPLAPDDEFELIEEYSTQNSGDPQAITARRVRAVTHQGAWAIFQQGYDRFTKVWKRKLVSRTVSLLKGGIALTGGYLTYHYMVQKAAASAASSSGNAAASVPSTRILRYAGAAGLLANSLTIAASLPSMVIAVATFVSSIKSGVQLKKTIAENEAALAQVRGEYTKRPSYDLAVKEMELVKTLTADRATLAGLPAIAVITATSTVASALGIVRAALGIASVALQASHGSAVTLGTLAQVSSVLGPLAATIGLGLGIVSLTTGGRLALKIYRESQAVQQRIEVLDGQLGRVDLSPAKRRLLELELNVLKNKRLQLKDDLRHTLITFASNLVLTFAGVVGLLSSLGVATGLGALMMGGVALALTGVSAGISVAHYFYRKHTQKVLAEQMRPQQMSSADLDAAVDKIKDVVSELSDDELRLLLPDWTTEEQRVDMIQKFRGHPDVYLKEYFSVLIPPEEKKNTA